MKPCTLYSLLAVLLLGMATPAQSQKKIFKSLDASMVLVKGGQFNMGESQYDNPPQETVSKGHPVAVSDYYISKYEVTQTLWTAVMGSNPSKFNTCAECPVENVSYDSAMVFIEKLNQATKKKYRLPTSAEWEYAARGGSLSKGYRLSGGDNENNEVAWTSTKSTQPVGTKQANELGLFDMSGNVFELCSDWIGERPDPKKLVTNPVGPATGEYKVLRGGCWNFPWYYSAIVYISTAKPDKKDPYQGFRLAKSVEP